MKKFILLGACFFSTTLVWVSDNFLESHRKIWNKACTEKKNLEDERSNNDCLKCLEDNCCDLCCGLPVDFQYIQCKFCVNTCFITCCCLVPHDLGAISAIGCCLINYLNLQYNLKQKNISKEEIEKYLKQSEGCFKSKKSCFYRRMLKQELERRARVSQLPERIEKCSMCLNFLETLTQREKAWTKESNAELQNREELRTLEMIFDFVRFKFTQQESLNSPAVKKMQ